MGGVQVVPEGDPLSLYHISLCVNINFLQPLTFDPEVFVTFGLIY